MPQLAMAALTAVTSAFTGGSLAAAGTAAASAAALPMGAATFTGAAAAASSGVSALSILQGAAGLMSVFSSLGQGAAQAQSYKMQAAQSLAAANQEQAQGMQRTTALKRELLRVVGENDVAYSSAGIDLTSGVAADARAAARTRASEEISIDRETTAARMAGLAAQAASYRSLARSAQIGSLFNAAGTVFQTGFDIYKRGVA